MLLVTVALIVVHYLFFFIRVFLVILLRLSLSAFLLLRFRRKPLDVVLLMLHFKLLAATVESILKVALLVVYVISIESFTVVVVSIRLAFTAFFFLLKLRLISVAMVHVLMTAYLHLELTGSLSPVLDLSAFDSCTVLMLLVDPNVLLYACGVSLHVINHVQLFDPVLPLVDHLSTTTFFAA